jgi:hypothetical protein
MGRYITGDFEWKFAFAEQSSSFSEVLDEILVKYEEKEWSENIGINEIADVERWISNKESGESIQLTVANPKLFLDACRYYIGEDFEVIESNMHKSEDYWNKLMVKHFIKQIKPQLDEDNTEFNFDVEY